MRTIIDLPKEQIEALDSCAKTKGISRAAVVREAVATYLPAKKKRNLNYWLKHPAFGSWKGPKVDSVEIRAKTSRGMGPSRRLSRMQRGNSSVMTVFSSRE